MPLPWSCGLDDYSPCDIIVSFGFALNLRLIKYTSYLSFSLVKGYPSNIKSPFYEIVDSFIIYLILSKHKQLI